MSLEEEDDTPMNDLYISDAEGDDDDDDDDSKKQGGDDEDESIQREEEDENEYVPGVEDGEIEDDEDEDSMLLQDEDEDEEEETKPKSKKRSLLEEEEEEMDEDDEEDDEYDEEMYLDKFDQEMTKNYIVENHPECLHHSHEEVMAMCKVTRDKKNSIVDPLHRTIPILTKYERARILGQRAKQIESGAKPFLTDLSPHIIDSHIIAEMELKQKLIPFIIRRPIPGGACEYWKLEDLENILF